MSQGFSIIASSLFDTEILQYRFVFSVEAMINTPAAFNKEPEGCWRLWRNIAAQSDEFGHPDKFCTEPEKSNWESCTVTCHDERVPEYIEKITKRSPYGGRTVTGGIVTAVDSSWLISWTVNRQEQYYGQPEKDVLVAETLDDPGRDTVFTIEYSGRTAMEAVYVLTGVEKGVPEVFNSRYDIRYLLDAGKCLLDGEKPEIDLPLLTRRKIEKQIRGTEIEELLKEYGII